MLSQIRNRYVKTNLSATLNVIRNSKSSCKPPNILIKTENKEHFVELCSLLNGMLDHDRYTIHRLSDHQFQTISWRESCCLLMFDVSNFKFTAELWKFTEESIKNFLVQCEGSVVFYSVTNADNINMFKDLVESFRTKKEVGKPNKASFQTNIFSAKPDLLLTLKLLGLRTIQSSQKQEITQEVHKTPAYLISFNNKKLDEVFQLPQQHTMRIDGKGINLVFVNKQCEIRDKEECGKNDMSVIINEELKSELFQPKLYQDTLKTKQYGKNILYSDTVDSTQTIFTGFNFGTILCDGLVVHAKRQLKGKGRSGNQWLSPLGCMMFSMGICIPVNSFLGQNLSIIQHLVVVAFVRSVKTKGSGYEQLDLNIKWPNDIYVRKTTKIGGVIVNTACMHGQFKVTIGLGVNVDNEKPTECLNSLIRQHNMKQGCDLPVLKMEEALAETINSIEYLVELFQEKGVDEFKKEYYRYWMHSGTEVILETRNNEKAIIKGIDDFGYLKVHLKRSGEEVLLQPDGNSFDMMRNMIVIKS